MQEIHGNNICPCNSRKRYSICCKKQLLKWTTDGLGNFYKQIPLNENAMAQIDEAFNIFLEVFERAPNRSKDPVFLIKYLIGEDELERQTVLAMHQAGLRPDIIYAYQKTGGLLITQENKELATTKDIKDWNAAIEEYQNLNNKSPQVNQIDFLLSSLKEELDSCIICLGYILEHGHKKKFSRIPSSSEIFNVDDYVLICAVKSIKTLRAIKILIENNIGADALALARHLLENYLHITYSLARPEMLKHVIDAQAGLKNGTHEFARTNNGRIDSRRIIRKSDGYEFIGHISYHKMAESSPYEQDQVLFDYIYSFLSDYTHPSFSGVALVLNAQGALNPLTNELQSEAIFYSVCFTAMILDELRRLPRFSKQAKKDISTITKRIRRKSNILFDTMREFDDLRDSFIILCDRLNKLGD